MSTYFGLCKSIKADELFDGRLEAFGVREEVRPEGTADRYPPYMKVKEVRYLTDGQNSMEVVIYENGVACINVRNLWCAPEREILHAIAEAFETDIVSEHQPEYWGFDTQEEWDADGSGYTRRTRTVSRRVAEAPARRANRHPARNHRDE